MVAQLHIVGVQFSSFVRGVQFCCEEIGLPYTLGTEVDGKQFTLRSEALKSINPFGKIPVLLHDGRALYEAQVICRYLDNTFNQSRLQPQDPWLRAQVEQWCAAITLYIDKCIVRNYLLEYLFPKGENGSVREDAVVAAMPEILVMVDVLEKQLGDSHFLVADQFTLADIMLTPILHYLSLSSKNAELLRADSPLRAYVARNLNRPSAKKVFI